jgi:hypothetical protein
MAWYTASLDEVQGNAARHQIEHVEPIQKVTEFLDHVISELLGSLGVDCSKSDISIGFQQQQLGINVVDLAKPEDIIKLCELGGYTPRADVMGIYIFQYMQPKYFIPDPKLQNGKVVVDFYSFEEDQIIGTGILKVPLK